MSLRLKTILGIALIEGTLLLLLLYTALSYMRSTNFDSLKIRAQTTTTLFATTTKDAVLSFDLASLDAFTSELLKNPGLRYVRVLDSDLELLSSAGDSALLALPFQLDTDPALVLDGVFDSQAVILEAGTTYGYVQLGISTEDMEKVLRDAQRWSVTIASVEMLLVALFSFVLGTYLTFQLAHLRRAARAVAMQNFDVTVPVKGRDEVAEVGHAFNEMTKGLRLALEKREQHEQELQELNASLEHRVEQRTQALQDKNHQLLLANEKIKEAQLQLMRSEKMASVGQLAAGVAHEINNPIGFVASNLQTLDIYMQRYQSLFDLYQQLSACDDQDEKRRELSHQIDQLLLEGDFEFVKEDIQGLLLDSVEGAERIRIIVQGLKEFSHEGEVQWQLADVNQCINSTVRLMTSQLKNHCEINCDLKPVPKTRCNPGQLNQVIMNIIMNASQAVEPEVGQINIRSSLAGDTIEIRVSDNGCGIPENVLAKLFDPFFTTKEVGKGTGLGLAISYGIMQDHGGNIEVRSKVGVGSLFCLQLPVSEDLANSPNDEIEEGE